MPTRRKEAICSKSSKKATITIAKVTIDKENDKKRDRYEVGLFTLNKQLRTKVKHLNALICNGVMIKDVALAKSKGDPDSPLWNNYDLNAAAIAEANKDVKQIEKYIEGFYNKIPHALECTGYGSKPPSRLFETPRSLLLSSMILYSSLLSSTNLDSGNSTDDDNE